MPTISYNIDHLRSLTVVIPPNIEQDQQQYALLKALLLFCKVLELGVSIVKCQDIDTLVLLRKDHKKNEVLKIYGAMTIIRFIHASEYSPYQIYPLYPVERARVDGTIDILLAKEKELKPVDLLKMIEENLL